MPVDGEKSKTSFSDVERKKKWSIFFALLDTHRKKRPSERASEKEKNLSVVVVAFSQSVSPEKMPSALVTGGGAGIGAATAIRLAERGYSVTVRGRAN